MKKVVIIGGGFAGAYCANALQSEFEVTLIDTKDYFEFTPSVLRTLVEPKHRTQIEVRHRDYLKQGDVVRAEAISMRKREVITSAGKYLFDYLIICSGSRYNTPLKEENIVLASRGAELQDYSRRLHNAEMVLIVGGGVVGVELAAEIVCAFPKKKITIVHAGAELLERNPPGVRKYARHFLEKRGVSIIFNEKIISSKNGNFKTDARRGVAADLAFICTGITPNAEFLPKSGTECIDEKRFVKVDEFLRMRGHTHIFAAGDITAIAEEKLAQNAEKQAAVVVHNIRCLEQGKELKAYRSNPRIMVISLGKWKGVLVYKKWWLGGIIPGIMKTLIEWKTMKRYR